MTKAELDNLNLPNATAFNGAPWRLFVFAMRKRQYDHDDVRAAWNWFLIGYTAHIRGPR